MALSVDRVFAPNDERLRGQSLEALASVPRQLMEQTIRPHLKAMDRDAQGTPALAALISLVVVSDVAARNSIGRVSSLLLHGLQRPTTEEYEALVALHEAIKHPPDE